MPEERPPFWKTLTRAGIPAGCAIALVGFLLHNVLAGATFTSPAILVPLLAGALLFFGGVAINLGWIWRRVTTRKFLVRLNAWAMTFLAILLLIIANTIVAMTPQTDAWFLDCTDTGVYTLSPKTKSILRSLDKDTRITVMLGSGTVDLDLQGKVNLAERMQDLVRLYGAASSRVTFEIVNTYRDKMRAQQIQARLDANIPVDTVVVEAARRHTLISFGDLISIASAQGSASLSFLGEAKLTEAILKVSEETQAAAYFLAGHGELNIAGPPEGALNRFVAELRRDNYRVESLNLLVTRGVPADCDVLVIAGPGARFQEQEVDSLRAYLEGGGKVFVLLRPRVMRGSAEGLDHLLADYNVKIQDDHLAIAVYRDAATAKAVLDPRVVIYKDDFGNHPITDEFRGGTANCLIENACPMTTVAPEQPEAFPGARALESEYRAVPLLRSPPDAWGETDVAVQPMRFDADKDIKGPLTLAMAVEFRNDDTRGSDRTAVRDATHNARLVVLGSTKAASDDTLNSYVGNRMLLMNSINWLARKEMKLGIPPQFAGKRKLNASPTALNAVFYITFLGMPLLGALCGGFVWWLRRRS